MCIRDRRHRDRGRPEHRGRCLPATAARAGARARPGLARPCLLYTSDAADERSSVDLGGRRIIKKKKRVDGWGGAHVVSETIEIQATQQTDTRAVEERGGDRVE